MDYAPTDVEVACSRLTLVLLILGAPLLVILVLLFVAIIVATPLAWAKLSAKDLATIYLLFPVLAVGFSWAVWRVARNRETLFTTFRVSPTGIVIQNSRYGVLPLTWDDVTRATYSSMGKMITLESPKLAKPLAIMNFGARGLTPEFSAARTVIEGAMRGRWTQRLF